MREYIVVFESFKVYLHCAIEIAVKEKISIYDALYLAQAEEYQTLVTSDDIQREIEIKLGITVEYIE